MGRTIRCAVCCAETAPCLVGHGLGRQRIVRHATQLCSVQSLLPRPQDCVCICVCTASERYARTSARQWQLSRDKGGSHHPYAEAKVHSSGSWWVDGCRGGGRSTSSDRHRPPSCHHIQWRQLIHHPRMTVHSKKIGSQFIICSCGGDHAWAIYACAAARHCCWLPLCCVLGHFTRAQAALALLSRPPAASSPLAGAKRQNPRVESRRRCHQALVQHPRPHSGGLGSCQRHNQSCSCRHG